MAARSFHNELHQLKLKVEDIAVRHTPQQDVRQSTRTPDDFVQQAADLQWQLNDIDQKLKHMADTSGMPHTMQATTENQAPPPEVQPETSWPPSSRDILPSGPLFWQLFTSLRTDVHNVEHRVSSLENAFSALEDRVDGLDPHRFTPTSSIGSSAEYLETETDPVNLMPNAEGRGSYDDKISVNNRDEEVVPPLTAPENGGIGCRASTGVQFTQGVSEHLLHTQVEASRITADIMKSYQEKIAANGANLQRREAKLLTAMVGLHQKYADIGYGLSVTSQNQGDVARVEGYTSNLSVGPTSYPDRAATVNSVPVKADSSALVSGNIELPGLSQPVSEGAAFRDREIARLEELLKGAQETQRMNDEKTSRIEQASVNSTAQCSLLEARLQELHQENAQLREEATGSEQVIQALEEHLRSMEARMHDLVEQINNGDRRSKEKHVIMCAAEQKLEQLQLLLQETQDSRHDLKRFIEVREEDLRKLQAFCEQKDTIAQSQEQIIARGARLMEQRDEEIESMTRTLKAAEDDLEHERRQTQRLTRLIEERDRELESAKAHLKTEAEDHKESIGFARYQDDLSPFARKLREVQKAPALPPRPMRGFRRLPSEEQRASVWEHAAQTIPGARAVFGQPNQIGSSQRSSGRAPMLRHTHMHGVADGQNRNFHDAESTNHASPSIFDGHHQPTSLPDSRTSDLPHDAQTDTLGSRASRDQQQASSNERRAGGRRGLPMERKFWPPLPAPVTAHRMHSMAELRSARHERPGQEDGPRRLPKHQSMQELKRKDLQEYQPYVETEVESGGEMGGEV